MLIPIYYVKDAKVRMRAVINELEKEIRKQELTEIEVNPETLKSIKNKYFTITTDMLTAFREILAVFKQHTDTFNWLLRGQNIINIIESTHRELKEMSIEELGSAVNLLMDAFGEEQELLSLSNTFYYESEFADRYAEHVSNTDFDQSILRCMVEHIQVNVERTIHVLDASIRNATNMSMFKTYIDRPVRTYAMGVQENKSVFYREAGFDRIALGGMKGATISNEVFDIMMLSPYVSIRKDSDRLLDKKEREAIRDSVKYLRPGGVLILSLPKFRFHKDICTALAKGYTNFQVRCSDDPAHRHYLYILAERKTNGLTKEIDKEAYNLLRTLHSKDDLKTIDEQAFEDITLPNNELEVTLFRGSILNKDELKDFVNTSPCLSLFLAGQLASTDAQRIREPLLPFTTGQLGLVLTSGALDGVIDEGNGHYHVVKGRVVKSKHIVREEDEESNSVTFTETVANRVEITAITADGAIKRLV